MRKHPLLALLQQLTGFTSLSLFRKKNEKNEKGEINVHRFSTGESLPLSNFCQEHHIVLSADDLAISDSDDIIDLKGYNSYSVKGVNIFKKNILYCYDLLHKHQTGWKAKRYQSLITNFAKKCHIPFEVAEKRIRPSTAHTYMNHQTVLGDSFMIGCRHYILKNDGSTDKRWVYTVYNYLYSAETSLEKAKVFVLLEGETDVVCFNHYFSKYNFVGVTCGGVASWLRADAQMQHLREKSPDAVFVSLFDADETGKKTGEKLSPNGIIPIKWKEILGGVKEGFDVCDAFQTFGNAQELILQEIEKVLSESQKTTADTNKNHEEGENTTAEGESVPNDSPQIVKHTERFQVRTNKVIELVRYKPIVVNKYLDEARNPLVHNLLDGKRILIHGHTELGKTTFIKNLSEDKVLMSKLNVEHVVIVTPRVMLAQEIYRSSDSFKTVLARGPHFSVSQITPEHKLIITNMDNVKKVREKVPNSVFIIDEIHKATSDTTFRDQQNVLFDLMPSAPYVIMMTATPDMNLVKYLNFSYLHCSSGYRTEHKKFEISYIRIEKKQDFLASYLCQIAKRKGQRHLVFHDSKDKLEIAAQFLKEMGLKAIVLTKDTCQELVAEGLEKLEKYDVLLCTSIADAGIDFKFRIDCVHHHFYMNTRDAVQGMGRGRGDINLNTEVFCYHPEKIQQTTDKTETEWFVPIHGENYELLEFAQLGFEEYVAKAEGICKGLNIFLETFDGKIEMLSKYHTAYEKVTYYSELEKKYKVNFAYCSQVTSKRPFSLDAHLKELQSLDNCVVLKAFDEPEKTEEREKTENNAPMIATVQDAIEAKKLSKKAMREKAIQYIRNDLYNAILYYCNFVKREDRRKEILDWLRTKEIDVAAGAIPPENLGKQTEDFNEALKSFLDRFWDIRNIIPDYESTFFVLLSSPKFRLEIRKLIMQWRLKERDSALAPKDRTAKKRAQELRHELHKVQQKNQLLTKKELEQIVRKIYPIAPGSDAMMYAMCVTNIVPIKDKYKVGLQWSLEDAKEVFTGVAAEKTKAAKKAKIIDKISAKELKKREKEVLKKAKRAENEAQKKAKRAEKKAKPEPKKTKI